MLVGYDTSTNEKRSWIHIIVFAGIMSLSVYVILDIEFPRFGLIQVAAADQVLIDLRQNMRQETSRWDLFQRLSRSPSTLSHVSLTFPRNPRRMYV